MTRTFRSTRRLYQRNPATGGDGVLSNPLARETGTNGEFRVTTEADRGRLYVTGQFTPATDYLGRIVSFSGTPPATGAAGTNKHDHTWYRIRGVDASGNWVELEGFRAEDAGTGITWSVHASVDFAAASASFPVDEGPLGPNSAPYPRVRTNTGPLVGQGIFFPDDPDQVLASQPWFVGDRLGSTSCRLVDWTGRYQTVPTSTGRAWSLRDIPAYTEEMFWHTVHRFMLECGWDLDQLRGKNNGTGAGRRISRDAIYRSRGEDERKEGYIRWIAVNDGSSADGSFSTGNTPVKGFDLAGFSIWDRDFVNTSGINPGNGVGAISAHENTNNRWASQADTTNSSSNQPPFVHPDLNSSNNGSIIGDTVGWSSPFHEDADKRSFRANQLGTVEGGDYSEIHYTFLGDRDEVHLMAEVSGFGTMYLAFGFLKPRPDANGLIFTTNFSAASGPNVTLRIGGEPGNATSDGRDPTNPGADPNGGDFIPYAIGDQIQIAGKTVNPGITPGGQSPVGSHSGEFVVPAQIIGFPGLLPATGVISTPAGSQIGDGDTVAISDGTSTLTFEFDSGGGVTGGNVAVAFTSGDAAGTVASALALAVTGSALNITAAAAGADVTLTSGLSGAGVGAGNVAMVTSLANPGQWTVEGMSGGGYSVQVDDLLSDMRSGAKVGEDPDPLFLYLHNKNVRSTSVIANPFNIPGAFITSNAMQEGDSTYFDGPIFGSSSQRGYFGFECVGTLETVGSLGESNPNRRGGRFQAVPVVCRDADGRQLRGTMRYMRFISPRIGTHKFVKDRQGDFHYIVPTYIQDTDGESNSGTTLGANFIVGPIPRAHAIV